MILSEGGLLTAAQFGILSRREHSAAVPHAPEPPSSQSLPEWEKRLVIDVLNKTKGNKSEAAKILGITRSQLYTRLKRFGLEP
jgi:DNA-binding NtrC family response regulator